jgi:hypothetical protein
MVLVDAAHQGLRVGIGGGETIRLGDGAKGTDFPHRTRRRALRTSRPFGRRTCQRNSRPWIRCIRFSLRISRRYISGRSDCPGFMAPRTAKRSGQTSIREVAGHAADRSTGENSRDRPEPGGWRIQGWRFRYARRAAREGTQRGPDKLVLLSSSSKQVIVHSGHNMNLEAPEDVSNAIREVVNAVRHPAEKQ